MSDPTRRKPISWVPSLYFVQGMQFFVVMLIAGLMFKNMGVPNDRIARWTGLLGLAWAIKPLWSPFLEMARSKKLIVVTMQFTGAIGLGLLALAIQMPFYFAASVGVLFLIAFLAWAAAGQRSLGINDGMGLTHHSGTFPPVGGHLGAPLDDTSGEFVSEDARIVDLPAVLPGPHVKIAAANTHGFDFEEHVFPAELDVIRQRADREARSPGVGRRPPRNNSRK